MTQFIKYLCFLILANESRVFLSDWPISDEQLPVDSFNSELIFYVFISIVCSFLFNTHFVFFLLFFIRFESNCFLFPIPNQINPEKNLKRHGNTIKYWSTRPMGHWQWLRLVAYSSVFRTLQNHKVYTNPELMIQYNYKKLA